MASFIYLTLAVLVALAEGQLRAGGAKDLDPTDPEVQKLSVKATTKYNSEGNGFFYMIPVKVLSARQQVVAGTKTFMEILVQESRCKRRVITVEVFAQPWKKVETITVTGTKPYAAAMRMRTRSNRY